MHLVGGTDVGVPGDHTAREALSAAVVVAAVVGGLLVLERHPPRRTSLATFCEPFHLYGPDYVETI